jgi:hypothetical protein
VDEGTALVAQYEREARLKQRQRRPIDQANHLMAIEATVANLAYAVLLPPPTGRIALLTGNGNSGITRYDSPAFGRPYRDLLDAFDAIGWLTWERGYRDRSGGVASSIAPTSAFRGKVTEAGVSLTDFGRIEGEEVILFGRKVDTAPNVPERRELVTYRDTAATRELRETMRSLNAFQAQADITFVDDGLGPVDLQNRVQRRRFLCDGDGWPDTALGGRLYGGAWQNLKRDRRARIRIEGEPVTLLDYSAMAPRLAYASVGSEPPPGDIYALPGIDPRHRDAVKKAFNTLLCDPYTRKRGWPKPKEGDPSLPSVWSVPRFREALLTRHPALMPCLGQGLSNQLQNTESLIIVEVMREMKARGIPVLTIHDGLLCPSPRASEVEVVMKDVALSTTSSNIPVSVQSLTAAPKEHPKDHIQEP